MKKRLLTLIIFIVVFIIQGCSNPYSKFYTDYIDGINVLEDDRFIISTDEPKLIAGSDIEEDIYSMLENGYYLLGISSFNSADTNHNQAIQHAKKVHADIVIVYKEYTNTVSKSLPMISPDTQTTYQSGSIYNPNIGLTSFSGSSTSYRTKTTYVPHNINMYNYYAYFWLKGKPPRLGILPTNLTPELRQVFGSNKGAYVMAVIKNSPAFIADILPHDIIRKINDTEVIDAVHFANLMDEYNEPNVKLEIFREGEIINKEITLASH